VAKRADRTLRAGNFVETVDDKGEKLRGQVTWVGDTQFTYHVRGEIFERFFFTKSLDWRVVNERW